MPDFRQTIASLTPTADGHAIRTPEDWAQGRTLFGGMTAALAYAAARDALGDVGPLRSAQLCFVGPASGELRFVPALLRRGRSSAVIAVDCHNADGLAARATFMSGTARDSAVRHDIAPRMIAPPPEECAPFHRTSKTLPGFLGKYEFRLAAGSRLFDPGARPEFAVWTRYRDDAGDRGQDAAVTALLALADALPCAAMVDFPKPAAISTMTWGIDLHRPPDGGGDWYLLSSTSESAADGYSLQTMRVHDRAGEPVASGRQLVALFV